MKRIALFCQDHRAFRDITQFFCIEKSGCKRAGGGEASPVYTKKDGSQIKIIYIRDVQATQGARFDKVVIEQGMNWTEKHRECLEYIAARDGSAYSDVYACATKVPHPFSPEYHNKEMKKRLKIFQEIGT